MPAAKVAVAIDAPTPTAAPWAWLAPGAVTALRHAFSRQDEFVNVRTDGESY